MPNLYSNEELEQAKAVAEHWLKYFAPPGFQDDEWNRDLMLNFIKYKCGGELTTENLNTACKANHANLHGLGVAQTPAQKLAKAKEVAEKAEAERLQKISAHNVTVATTYLMNRAPSGLLVNGDFYQESADKIIVFVKRNYPSQPITDAMLTEAIETLGFTNGVAGGSLDWFDKSPNAVVFRNIPPPPPRKLSRQAQIEAGMIPAETERPNHRLSDSPLKSPEDIIKFMAKQELLRKGVSLTSSPIMAEADAIVVQGKRGKVDPVKSAEIRKMLVYTNGKLDEIATLRARNKAAEKYERDKNQI